VTSPWSSRPVPAARGSAPSPEGTRRIQAPMRRMAAMAIALACVFTLGGERLGGTEAQAASRVVRVPASIDYKGRRDVSSQLQRLIDRAPDGATIRFRSRGIYLLRHGIRLSNRRDLVLDGNG